MKSILLLLACLCCVSWGQYPSSGLYMSLSDVVMSSSAQSITSEMVNFINSYTGWPSQSGSSSSASYTFSGWQIDIALDGARWKVEGTNELLAGWHYFNFSIQGNYHICASAWPNPCEDGNIAIYTTDSRTALYMDIEMDLTVNPPFFNVSTTSLQFDNQGIEIQVQCTNTICIIPVDDIAQAIAENFVPIFQAGVTKAGLNAIEKEVSKFKTDFVFADGLGVDVTSNWFMLPGNTGGENGFIFIPVTGGFFTDVSGTTTFPPYPPGFTPPIPALQNPQQGLTITITEYFFQSFMWALSDLNFFDKTITSAEVPAISPVKLTTNDPFFQQVVPGLSAYPNMDITVTSSLVDLAVPTIDTLGLHAWGTNLTFDFTLSNSSYSKHGWTLSNVFDIDLDVTAAIDGTDILFNATITNFTSTVIVTETDCGPITAAGFTTLYQLLEGVIKLPGFLFKVPPTYSVSNPSLDFDDAYIVFGADMGTQVGKVPYKPHISIS